MGALKDLVFSKYFLNYYGFDDMSDLENNMYFFEIKRGKNIKKILMDSGKTMQDLPNLFKYWIKEILIGLRYAFLPNILGTTCINAHMT
jgi:hypothetical protein